MTIAELPIVFLTPAPWEDFGLFSQQFISGVASGSLFAILALAIVMIYRSTDVLNFGQGEMALFTTFIMWSFMTRMDFWMAFVLVILVAAVLGAALERFVLRPVAEAPVLNSIVVTLGLFVVFNGLSLWIWGAQPKSFGPFSVFKGPPTCVADVCIGRLNIGILVVTFIMMVVLYVLFQHTKLGLALRATAQNRTASRLVGVPVGNMLSVGWGLSAAVGAVAGVMAAQSLSLTTGTMFSVLLFAFAAAVLGGLNSPIGAVVGGLAIGVIKNMAGTYVPPEVGSVDLAVAFLVIVLVLMVKPTGLFGTKIVRRV
jgi:branched-chain amino acid transport system permease protein